MKCKEHNTIRACDFILKLKKIIASYELKTYYFGWDNYYHITLMEDGIRLVVASSWYDPDDDVDLPDLNANVYFYKIKDKDIVLCDGDEDDDGSDILYPMENADRFLREFERVLKEFSEYKSSPTVSLEEVYTSITLKPNGFVLSIDVEEFRVWDEKQRFKRSKEYTWDKSKCKFGEISRE